MSVADTSTLRSYQCAQLRKAAESHGRLKDLLYFHSACRDTHALAKLAKGVMAGHPEDQLLYRLLHPDDRETPTGPLQALEVHIEDPWVCYTYVKYLLHQDQIKEAVSVVVAWLGRGQRDTAVLNLIARQALYRGHTTVARSLLAQSLRLAPAQRDMTRVLNALENGTVAPEAPCLDILPPACRVSYYLPCYNVAEHVARTIEAVAGACHPLEEILVIDDASPDEAMAIAAAYPVRILRHPENRGLAAARNTAWQHLDSEFIATVDTDACPDPGYLKYALMEFEQGADTLALSGGRLIEQFCETPADAWRTRHMAQDPGRDRFYVDGSSGPTKVVVPCAWDVGSETFLTGSDTLARRSALETVGGYSERCRSNAEDLTLCAALREQGFGYVFTPHCRASHYRQDTVSSVLRTAWNYGFWHRVDSGCYASAASLVALLDDHHVASQHHLMEAIEAGACASLYIDFLRTFYSTLLDVNYGVDTGLLSPGQAMTVQQALEEKIHALDQRFGGNLLAKVRGDLSDRLVSALVEPCPLDHAAAAVLGEKLAYLQQDHGRYNQALYDLLVGE